MTPNLTEFASKTLPYFMAAEDVVDFDENQVAVISGPNLLKWDWYPKYGGGGGGLWNKGNN